MFPDIGSYKRAILEGAAFVSTLIFLAKVLVREVKEAIAFIRKR